jgi:hypothetical protein
MGFVDNGVKLKWRREIEVYGEYQRENSSSKCEQRGEESVWNKKVNLV